MKTVLSCTLFMAVAALSPAREPARSGDVASPSAARNVRSDNPFSSLVGADHYYTEVSTGYKHTTNAFADFREIKDWYLDTNVSAGWRSTLGSSMYLDLSAFVNRLDYANQDVLSRNVLGTRVSVAGLLGGRLPYFLTYTGQWLTDSSYDSIGTRFHNLSTVVPLFRKSFGRSGTLSVLSSFTWVKAEPSDFDQVIPGLVVNYILPVTDRDKIRFSLVQSYSFYEHFRPGQFIEGDRQDWLTSISLQWVHDFTKNISFTAGVSYLRSDSNLTGFDAATGRTGGLYDYKAWTFSPTISMNFTF